MSRSHLLCGCESWTIKKAEELMLLNCGAGETLESPLDCKEIKPVSLKENKSGRTDAEAPILWPPDGKHPDAGNN